MYLIFFFYTLFIIIAIIYLFCKDATQLRVNCKYTFATMDNKWPIIYTISSAAARTVHICIPYVH